MAKGMLGKSRSPPQSQGISKPHLRYTDAVPRNDLQDIQPGVSYSRPMHQTKAGQQLGMSAQQDSRGTDSPAPNFDFRVTSPPTEASNTHLGVDESMIGIALGSPRMLEPRNNRSLPRQIPPPTPPQDERSAALQRKSSKWRKIGGLFKAKNAIAPPTSHPFYQVRGPTPNEGPYQDSTHSVDYKSRGRGGAKTEPFQNTEVWPCLASENEALEQQQNKPKVPGSFLQVEIPQVEMERYSVMFGGLLNSNRPSLLDRRSKTLDNLTIPGKEEPFGPPQRRATSPVPSVSPGFKIFPTMPSSKAAKVLGTQNIPQVPDPLRKTHTSHASLDTASPSRPSSQNTLTQNTHLRPNTQTSRHHTNASVTSFLSATSIGSDDEPLLIHKFEPVRTYAGMKEPNWDLIRKKSASAPPDPQPSPIKASNPDMNPNITINTRELGSDSNSLSSATSSPILSPLSLSTATARTSSSVFSPAVGTGTEPISFFPPPRTSSRPEAQQAQNGNRSKSKGHADNKSQNRIPSIEVSVARSVSVSRGKNQVIVPVRTRLTSSHERLVARQAKTPKVSGPAMGHRPHLSQDARIEMV